MPLKGLKRMNNGFRLLRTCYVPCLPAQSYAHTVNLIFVTTLEDRYPPFYKCQTKGPTYPKSQSEEMAELIGGPRRAWPHVPCFPHPTVTSTLINRSRTHLPAWILNDMRPSSHDWISCWCIFFFLKLWKSVSFWWEFYEKIRIKLKVGRERKTGVWGSCEPV